MVKKVILTGLFVIFLTALFGLFTIPVFAQSCTTTGQWPGTCVLESECNSNFNGDIVWDETKCPNGSGITSLLGCCGIKPGASENSLPELGASCTTSAGWSGTCTKNADCAQSQPGIAYDITRCKAGGCCGKESPVVGAACTTKDGFTGTCTEALSCVAAVGSGVAWDPNAAPCNTLSGWGCCGKSDVVGKSCTTKQGWVGTCTLGVSCATATVDSGLAWDPNAGPCNTLSGYGCCGKSDVVGKSCTTKQGWVGTCSMGISCNGALDSGIAWDPNIPTCNVLSGYGCCGKNSVVGESCSTTQGWPGTCQTSLACDGALRTGVVGDPNVLPCDTLSGYVCCGTNPSVATATTSAATNACDFAGPNKSACVACSQKNNNTGVWTAIGCITTDPANLLGTILGLALGVAGGIAFLLILFGGLQIMTSAGNPEQLNAGRELVTSAIIGLILILFSIFLLQFIGVNIIGIPGFTSTSTSDIHTTIGVQQR